MNLEEKQAAMKRRVILRESRPLHSRRFQRATQIFHRAIDAYRHEVGLETARLHKGGPTVPEVFYVEVSVDPNEGSL